MLAFVLVEVADSIQILAQDKEESRELYNWLFSIKNSGIHEDKVWEQISFFDTCHQLAFFIASQQNIWPKCF